MGGVSITARNPTVKFMDVSHPAGQTGRAETKLASTAYDSTTKNRARNTNCNRIFLSIWISPGRSKRNIIFYKDIYSNTRRIVENSARYYSGEYNNAWSH